MEKVFLPKSERSERGPGVLILVEEDRVHAAWSRDGGDVPVVTGESISKVFERIPRTDCLVLTREQMDSWVSGAVAAGNFLTPVVGSPLARKLPHFLLRWMDEPGRLPGLPKAFGLYLRVTEPSGEAEETLLIRRNGRLDQVTRPDFPLETLRKRGPLEALRSLGERYGVPMQIVELPRAEWERISANPKPWRELLAGIRQGRIQLSPAFSRLGTAALLKWL